MFQSIAFDIGLESSCVFCIEKGLVVPQGTRVQHGIPTWEPPKDALVLTKLLLGIKKKKQIVEEEEYEPVPIVDPLESSDDDGQSSDDDAQSSDASVTDDAQDSDDS